MHQKTLFLAIATLFTFFVATATVGAPLNAHADFGPKPKTILTLRGMEAVDTYYVAPLSQTDFGPANVVSSTQQLIDLGETPDAIDEQMLTYTDVNDFLYTTLRYHECQENETIQWGYRPPDPFKVLILIPDNGSFVVSPILERTTFESYFTLSLSGADYLALPSGSTNVIPEAAISNTYNVFPQILGIVARMLLTLMIELGLAWLFKYRSKKQLLTIVLANVVTQLALNIGLNLIYLFEGGGLTYWLVFFVSEILVFLAEAIFYKLFFTLKAEKEPKHFVAEWAIFYALLANVLSMGVGILLSYYWNFGLF